MDRLAEFVVFVIVHCVGTRANMHNMASLTLECAAKQGPAGPDKRFHPLQSSFAHCRGLLRAAHRQTQRCRPNLALE